MKIFFQCWVNWYQPNCNLAFETFAPEILRGSVTSPGRPYGVIVTCENFSNANVPEIFYKESTGWPKKMCTHENFNCDFD